MARKVSEEDWKTIEREIRESEYRYKILDVEDGEVIVEFVDTIYETQKGDEDLLGRIWEKDWSKIEAKVLMNGTPCIMSFAWRTSAIFRTFKARCQELGISPNDLPGTKWTFEKKSASEYIIKYLGKSDVKEQEIKLPDKDFDEIVNVIKALQDEPELMADGINEGDFIKAIAIRTNSKVSKVREYLPELISKKLIKLADGKIYLVGQ